MFHKACAALAVLGILLFTPLAAQEESSPEQTTPALIGYRPAADPMAPIEVGAQKDVGKESFASKQGKKVVGGLLNRVLGGSKSSSGKAGPRTRRDPTRRQDYLNEERGVIDADTAPVGIRDEVKRLVKLRELMRTISRNCGNPPVPPAVLVD